VKKGTKTMAKKKSVITRLDIERGQAAAKAQLKSLQKSLRKMILELKKVEKGLSNRSLTWHLGD
jgi:hypothetical protein